MQNQLAFLKKKYDILFSATISHFSPKFEKTNRLKIVWFKNIISLFYCINLIKRVALKQSRYTLRNQFQYNNYNSYSYRFEYYLLANVSLDAYTSCILLH